MVSKNKMDFLHLKHLVFAMNLSILLSILGRPGRASASSDQWSSALSRLPQLGSVQCQGNVKIYQWLVVTYDDSNMSLELATYTHAYIYIHMYMYINVYINVYYIYLIIYVYYIILYYIILLYINIYNYIYIYHAKILAPCLPWEPPRIRIRKGDFQPDAFKGLGGTIESQKQKPTCSWCHNVIIISQNLIFQYISSEIHRKS